MVIHQAEGDLSSAARTASVCVTTQMQQRSSSTMRETHEPGLRLARAA
jgi:hypothetical protein